MSVQAEATESFTVVSPVNDLPYLIRPYDRGAKIEGALLRAKAAARTWRLVPIAQRLEVIRRFAKEMEARAGALAEAVTWEMGRPLWQADETPRLKLMGELLGKAANVLEDESYPSDPGIRRFVRRVPVGVNLSICAWNYPTAMLGYLVSCPIIAGNVVLLKHSPQTPMIAEMAEEAFRAADGPEGVFQSIHLTHRDAEALIASGEFQAVNFIGSVAGGRRVHAAAGGTFTHVHLELGGKDPAYVRADADLAATAVQLAEGCYSNSGQSCQSVERLYVDAAVHDQFVEALTEETRKWTLGHPIETKSMIGPVVRVAAADKIRDQVAEACAKGANRTLTPGWTGAETLGLCYIEPQVLTGLQHGMEIMRDELFGPVACIQKVSGDAEAVKLMNDSPYGLTASVWTMDIEMGTRLLDELDAGTVFLNRCDHADLYLPWGGVKQSGLGRANGRAGLNQATSEKSFHIRDHKF
jgi:acyl-CoA reductase-like NAD-dependent aldehyde dehydrogenase